MCARVDSIVDRLSVHSVALPWLLHGREHRVWGDSAYTGQAAVLRACALHAQDFTQRKAGRQQLLSRAARATNRQKSRVRAKVELRSSFSEERSSRADAVQPRSRLSSTRLAVPSPIRDRKTAARAPFV